MCKPLYDIKSDKFDFRQMAIEDTDQLHLMASDEDVSRYIGWPLTHSKEETESYVKSMIEREAGGGILYANFSLKGAKEIIGTIMLFAFDYEAKHGEIGYVLRKDQWGKGYISELVQLVSDFALNELNLRKLHGRVSSPNMGSSKVLLKNGFVEEGRLKDYYYIDGSYCDVIWYGKFL
ncbi:MAG: GNAT family N-acetyltransferase [Clostridia bacterium]|nr:GNAT family N-acetyltransferase [Clostridia bacterium]